MMFCGLIISPMIIMGLTGVFLATTYYTDCKELKPTTRDKSQKIAEDFLLRCPTFQFDGIYDSIKLSVVDVMPRLHCWKFTFTFNCRQSGYGNRNGQNLLPIPEQHRISITIENGNIAAATIDDIWDEIKQQTL
jgi:hypothetical protein